MNYEELDEETKRYLSQLDIDQLERKSNERFGPILPIMLFKDDRPILNSSLDKILEPMDLSYPEFIGTASQIGYENEEWSLENLGW